MATRVPPPSHRKGRCLDRLRELATLLVESPPARPTAVGVGDLAAEHVEVTLRALDDDDVVAALAGFRAPPSWEAFGIVAPARAQSLDDSAPPRPVVIAVFADRSGHSTDVLGGFDGPAAVSGEGEGRLLDVCRRILGLATPPPEHDVALWSAFEWLDRALRAVLDADLGEPPAWAVLAQLDPAIEHAGGSWPELRARCADGALVLAGVQADAAAWMDDGMFSREAITAYPPLSELLADLQALVPSATFERLLGAVARRVSEG